MIEETGLNNISELDLIKIKCFSKIVRLTVVYILLIATVMLIGYNEFGKTWALVSYLTPIGWIYWLLMLREIVIGSQGAWKYYLSWFSIIPTNIVSPGKISTYYIQMLDNPVLMSLMVAVGYCPYFFIAYGYYSLKKTTRKNNVPIGLLGPKII